jgi:hypothetical protein
VHEIHGSGVTLDYRRVDRAIEGLAGPLQGLGSEAESKPRCPANSAPRAVRQTAAEARAVLEVQRASGLCVFAFARHEGVDPQRCNRWRQRLGTGHGGGERMSTRHFSSSCIPIARHDSQSGTAVRVLTRESPSNYDCLLGALRTGSLAMDVRDLLPMSSAWTGNSRWHLIGCLKQSCAMEKW